MRKNKSNEYGIYLRETRRRSGKTFEEISEKFGWSKGTLLMHEKNLSKPTNFDRVIEFAGFLGVPPEEMISRLIVDRGELILAVPVKDRDRLKDAIGLALKWYSEETRVARRSLKTAGTITPTRRTVAKKIIRKRKSA